jgi:hypothetical protein
MKQLRSVTQWKALYAGGSPHSIFTLTGVSHYSLEPDELHLLYLGTVQYFLGLVWYVPVSRLVSGSPETNMRTIWARVSSLYTAHGVQSQYSTLNIASFANVDKPHESYPKLKGKGAKVKDLVFPLSEIWNILVDANNKFFHPVRAAFHHQLGLQEILHDYRAEVELIPETCKFIFADLPEVGRRR